MKKFLPLAFILLAASCAHADTYTTYNVQSTFNSPGNTGMINGTLTYDNTTGAFLNGSTLITSGFPNANGSNGQPLTQLYGQGQVQTGPTTFADDYYVAFGNPSGSGVYFYLPGTTFANLSSISICTTTSNCPAVSGYGNIGFGYDAISGTLTNPNAISATPEPSSLILLGTGLLSAAGMMRRRVSA